MVERSDVNRVRVEILGSQYTLRGRESVAHMKQVARLVDDVMREITESHSYLDMKRVAVLAAINVADELVTLRRQYEELQRSAESAMQSPPK